MMYYEWERKEAFDTWHQNLCDSLGYPLIPVNQLTGLPDESAQKVEKYTDAIEVDNVFIAFVEEHYAEGLTPSDKTPPLKPINLGF
jgi:hypothetical protein